MEPVALNNHPRTTWPKDQRRDLQSRHRQLAATRSLLQPIITGTYSAKYSPPLKRTSGPRTPDPECHHRRSPDEQEGWSTLAPPPPPSSLYICPSRSLFISLLFALTISDNQGPRPSGGWTASLIRAHYAGRLKRFNCPTRRTSRSRRNVPSPAKKVEWWRSWSGDRTRWDFSPSLWLDEVRRE